MVAGREFYRLNEVRNGMVFSFFLYFILKSRTDFVFTELILDLRRLDIKNVLN